MTGLQMQRQILDLQRQVERISTWDSPGEGGGKQYATFVVAASDTTAAGKANADYVCTGTNDEVEINAALNATTPSTYRRVLLLEGTYNVVVGVIVIDDANTTLEGQGDGTVLACTSNGAGTIIISVTAADVHIQNIRFNISGAASTGAVIKGSGATRLIVQDCHFRSPSRAIWALNCDDSRVSNNLFYDFNIGVLFDSCDYAKANDNIGYPNTVTGSIVRATNTCNYVLVTGNESSGSGSFGFSAIDIGGGTGHNVTGNTLYTSDTGIYVNGDGATVTGNTIIESVSGILLNGDNNVCVGNVLRNTTGDQFYGNGIYITDWNSVVSGNYVTGFMYGIYLNTAVGSIVSDNYLMGNSWVTSPTASQTAGIFLYIDCEEILVANNYVRKAYVDSGGASSNVQAYGIRIDDSSNIDNVVIYNDIRDGGATGDFHDSGTNTLYRNYDGSTKQLSRTIATGVISVPGQGYFTLLPETGTADDLDTINGGLDGVVIYVRNENATNTVTLKDGTGNLDLQGADVALNAINVVQALIYDETQALWLKA